jgi:hypothetical protein
MKGPSMKLISKAEKAIRTGQPNLAMIYMRRDLSDSPQYRAWLARFDYGQALMAARKKAGRPWR